MVSPLEEQRSARHITSSKNKLNQTIESKPKRVDVNILA